MSTKLEQMIEALASDTQAIPNRNILLMGLRDALDEIHVVQARAHIETELTYTYSQTITQLQETIHIQEQSIKIQSRTIQALQAQHAQTSALCDKYQPTVYATEYTLDANSMLDNDLLSRCESLLTLFDENGYVETFLIRVRGQL